MKIISTLNTNIKMLLQTSGVALLLIGISSVGLGAATWSFEKMNSYVEATTEDINQTVVNCTQW